MKQSTILYLVAFLILPLSPIRASDGPLKGISFAVNPGRVYLPIEEAAQLLDWELKLDDKEKTINLNGKSLSYWSLRRIIGGGALVNVSNLVSAGAIATTDDATGDVTVSSGDRQFVVTPGEKKVVVDLEAQRLRAWEGERLVLDCHISSGRGGRTPSGEFRAGPYKARIHYSSRYRNAPMPYSVQISGHIFVHGFSSVPKYPASHGCIRMHLDQGNPARFFYEWVDRGVPIRIVRKTPDSEKKGPETDRT